MGHSASQKPPARPRCDAGGRLTRTLPLTSSLSLTDTLRVESEAAADVRDPLRPSSRFSLLASVSITAAFSLGTPRQARRARRPTPRPAGRRRRDAAPHSRTGSGRRDRKWRGGDSEAFARGGRDRSGRFKKNIQSPEELYLQRDARTAACVRGAGPRSLAEGAAGRGRNSRPPLIGGWRPGAWPRRMFCACAPAVSGLCAEFASIHLVSCWAWACASEDLGAAPEPPTWTVSLLSPRHSARDAEDRVDPAAGSAAGERGGAARPATSPQPSLCLAGAAEQWAGPFLFLS